MPCSDLIECAGCGRSFVTEHGSEMLAAITGPCPTCGGRFCLAQLATTAGAAGPGSSKPLTAR